MVTLTQVDTALKRFSDKVDAGIASSRHYLAIERIRESFRGPLPQASFALYASARRRYALSVSERARLHMILEGASK